MSDDILSELNEVLEPNTTVISDANDVSEEEIDSYVVDDDIMYSTGDAAKILNTSADLIRYYANDFQNELHVTKSKSGKGAHWKIPASSIECLRTIIQLRKEGKNIEEIRSLINNKNLSFAFENGSKMIRVLEQLLAQNNDYMLNQFKAMTEEYQKGLISDNHAIENLIEEQIKDTELLKKELAKKEKKLEEAEKYNQELNQTVLDMNERIEKMQAMIEERLPEKKGLFGFRKKKI